MTNSEFKYDRLKWPLVFLNERWIQISSFIENVSDRYWISDYGRVFDSNIKCCLNPIFEPNGYLCVSLEVKHYKTHNQHTQIFKIHRLVCMAYNGIPDNVDLLEVNHKDTIKLNNYYTNLEWCTRAYNVKYSFESGNRGVGENSNHSVYTEDQVRKICMLMQSGIYDYQTICRMVFGCDKTNALKTLIYGIRNRMFWTSISKDYEFSLSEAKVYNLTSEQVHSICKYLDDHPELLDPSNKKSANIIAKEVLNIDLSTIDSNASKKLRHCINNIKCGASYKSISNQYLFINHKSSTTIP